jgi:hypothetical protein
LREAMFRARGNAHLPQIKPIAPKVFALASAVIFVRIFARFRRFLGYT